MRPEKLDPARAMCLHARGDDFVTDMFGFQWCWDCYTGEQPNTNSTVDDRERRKALSCSFCRPNRGENAKRKPKPDRQKTRRKGR